MKTAFLFPGQGSQTIGMGKDLYDNYQDIKELYNKVKDITGIDIAKITFEEEEMLNQTKYTQLAILTMSLGILKILEKNEIKADISAGLSLGEYTSLICSKALNEDDGIKIVQNRGKYMQDLVPKGEWLMAAILGMEELKVAEVCEKAEGFVVPVNFNCEGQIVISGDRIGVQSAETIAKEEGAKRVVELNTSGPFHTKKLIEASNALRKDLDNIKFKEFEVEVVKNLDGIPYTNNDNMIDILAKHIISPVKFSKSIHTMLEMGVDTFIEIGPGKTLSGFVKKTSQGKEVNIFNINNIDTLEKVLNFFKEEKNG